MKQDSLALEVYECEWDDRKINCLSIKKTYPNTSKETKKRKTQKMIAFALNYNKINNDIFKANTITSIQFLYFEEQWTCVLKV